MACVQIYVTVSLCVLGLSLSLVSGQFPATRLAPHGNTNGADFTGSIMSFDRFGIGTGSFWAIKCFIDPTGNNWFDPTGTGLWPGRVGSNPSATKISLAGHSGTDGVQGILLYRGASYYALDGWWCCGSNDRALSYLDRCVTLTPCPTLPVLTNGAITYNRFTNVATYSCDSGYRLEGNGGSTTRTCSGTTTSAGTWSGSQPSCVEKKPCYDLSVENGYISYNKLQVLGYGRPYGTYATYICNLGFTRKGNAERNCFGDNVWTGHPPTCEVSDCGQPTSPSNGAVELVNGSTTYGNIALYSCDTCYELVGASNILCGGDENWPSAPKCVVKMCVPPPAPANGHVRLPPDSSCGSEVVYDCDPGYLVVGPNVRTCQPSGDWSKIAPVCHPVECGVLTAPSHGSVDTSGGTHFPSVVSYSCDPGYNLTGCSTAQCQADGTWSCDPPFCADNVYIQIKFGPTSHCVEWSNWRVELFYTKMRSLILRAIQRYGDNAILPKENIAPGYFSCFHSTSEATFRTRITGTESVSAVDYAAMIQRWVESGVSTRLQWYIIKIDKDCPVHIESMEEDECLPK